MARPSWAPSGIDIDRPSVARVYDSYLGGFHNFACDREVAERTTRLLPESPLIARTYRACLKRVVQFYAESGLEQFLDLGSGIPTVGNVHEIAQRANPRARVVYVDIDPVAVAHSEAILIDNDRAICIQADVRRPKQILGDDEVCRMLDFDQPVAVLMMAVLHFLPDEEDPAGVVSEFYDALAPGSYLAITHGSDDVQRGERIEAGASLYQSAVAVTVRLRSREEIGALFRGFDLVEPGLVPVGEWRPDPTGVDAEPQPVQFGYCGVGRKP